MLFVIQGMSTIAPSSFPGLPIFLPRCEKKIASFGVRVYVSIVTGGSVTTSIVTKSRPSGRGFYPVLR